MNEINISDVLNRISYSNNPTMAIAMVLEELNKVIFELNDVRRWMTQLEELARNK